MPLVNIYSKNRRETFRGRVRETRIREKLELVKALAEALRETAAQFETVPEYWIDGGNEEESYCLECAREILDRLEAYRPDGDLSLAGGNRAETDIRPFCAKCDKPLEVGLTGYGCEREIAHFQHDGFDPDDPEDCYQFCELVDTVGYAESEPALSLIILSERIIAGLPAERQAEIRAAAAERVL